MSLSLIPFKYFSDVQICIPKLYKDNISWFSITPQFTTLRVNVLKYSPEEIAEKIRNNLSEEATKNGFTTIPEVFVHGTIKDCIIIGSWKKSVYHDLEINGEVIIDVSCGNAVLRGADIFAPGVLALSNNVREGDAVNIYVDIKGTCRRGSIKLTCDDKLLIGNGIVKINRKTIFENNAKLNGIAIEVKFRASRVPSINFSPSYGILQNFPSIICSYVLEPSMNLTLLDMCASPGNKTSHLATIMKNKGTVIALDKTSKKVDKILSLCRQLELFNILAFAWDSTKAVLNELNENKKLTDGPPFNKNSFDRILLDAPCSALGNRPNLYNKITFKQLQSYSRLQKQLLHNAVELLKPGGILVYSTCTVTIEENEAIVLWALQKYSNLKLVKALPYFGSPGLIESGLSDEQRSCVQRYSMSTGNSPETDTVGFFIAKFVKSLNVM
ncbi:hypothetical protein O3M35_010369 [Rhynocoris fuscipes]|uniref:SAM-dependent MTase RsmB/NOP-type domain-containing protein n=1 Tax=Rhynocoris fuscipes TaxID=488301 RepID=A0AAW1D4S9_9HEMI